MKRTTKAKKPVEQTIVAYKGFDRSLQCRGFQYEVGKTYEHDGDVEACAAGFHACEHPLKVFAYYAPGKSRYAEVALAGTTAREASGDTKIAAAKITINVELSIGELVQRAWDYTWSRATVENGGHATGYQGAASATSYQGAASATGDWGAASATGYQGAASATGDWGAASATGDWGAASATGNQGAASATGDWGAASATGNRGAASATGYQGAASATGNRGAASATGYQGAASATGYQGAASATGNQGAASATGNQGAASATGNQGAASATGNQGAASATGDWGAAMSSGRDGRVQAAEGNALFLVERNYDYEIIAVWAGIAGHNGIKPMCWYTLRGGQPVEVK